MLLTNNQIYSYAVKLGEAFEMELQKLPIKINFYFQKNKNLLIELAKDIEKARLGIVQNYGEYEEETDSYVIAPENSKKAQQELLDLFNLTQEVQIYTVKINDFPNDFSLTSNQMEILMFMIED